MDTSSVLPEPIRQAPRDRVGDLSSADDRFRFLRTESFRLTAIFTILLVGAMLALTGFGYFAVQRAVRSELLLTADEDLASIRQAFASEGLGEAREVVNQLLGPQLRPPFLVLQDGAGRRLAGNLAPVRAVEGEQVIDLPGAAPRRHGQHRVIGRGSFIAPNLFAFAGRDLAIADHTEEEVLQAFGFAMLLTLPLALGGGTLLSFSFLHRTDVMARTCRRIMQGHFQERIPLRGTEDALDQLAAAINIMLDRIGALMANVRQISGDIAHDLRTPLTRLRARLETARQESSGIDDYEYAIDRAIRDSDDILSIFSALLRIGQMESGSERPKLTQLDLSKLLEQLCDAYRPAAEDAGHALETAIAPGMRIAGDRALLSQLFANLIENAIRHTPPETPITVGLASTQGTVRFFVRDRGPGIPSQERESVFRPFYRMEAARSTPGSGLGLALVAAIAKYHGARITLEDAAPGVLFVVELRQVSDTMRGGNQAPVLT
jgi:signal transduction histidine kinase